MDGEARARLRVAIVDLDADALDALPGTLAHADVPWPDVRLVIAADRSSALWRWARLAGVPRAGEVAALADVVVDLVVVDATSPRRSSVVELAAVLGAIVIPHSSASARSAAPLAPSGPRS
ncbi:MAG: hypothetical protein ACREOU_05105 [Candidatus Eiseniibacteriota bacterium]